MPKELRHEDLIYIAENARPAFEKLRGKTILLTGTTGFFGTWVLESLCFANKTFELNVKLVALARDAKKWTEKFSHLLKTTEVKVISGDVTDFTLPEMELDHIIHLASPDQNAIAPAMKQVLETARAMPQCSVLFSSSGAVYGVQNSTHVREQEYPLVLDTDRHHAYAKGKREAEELAQAYFERYGVETKIARCFCFSGPLLPQDSSYAFGNFIRDGLKQKTIQIAGDGSPLRSYMDAADLVVWLLQILVFGKALRPYNVGSEEEISIAELANKIGTACGVSVEIKTPRKEGAIPARYVPSTRRAREELGLKIGVSLEDSIKKTLLWHTHD